MSTNVRHVIVIGASADGIHAISQVLHDLPATFAAPVLIVQHIGGQPSALAEMLARTSKLPVTFPESGQPLQPGCVYVAPPDHHMVLHMGQIHLHRGPREGFSRPSIDVLFRSAADEYGSGVIGVVLTGYLHDGVAGMQAIKAHGGITVVQDPSDAAVADMPRAVLAAVPVDHQCTIGELGPLLVRLTTDPADQTQAWSQLGSS